MTDGDGLNLGQADSPVVPEVLAAEGIPEDDVAGLVAAILGGRTMVLSGASGPVLPALHLRAELLELSGPLEPRQEGLFAMDCAAPAHAVTGPGFDLYRRAGRCVALAAPRGAGWVVYLGLRDPDLAAACRRWVEMRS